MAGATTTAISRRMAQTLTTIVKASNELDNPQLHVFPANWRYAEVFQMARYDEGQYYAAHSDFTVEPGYDRVATFLIYLSDAHDGGETVFPYLRATTDASKAAEGQVTYVWNKQRFWDPDGLIANLSARVSSIGDNGIGGWYSYRSSKSALNQLTKTLSIELARKKPAVACVLLHPGTCETDLSAPFRGNVPPGKLFSRELAVSQLLGVLNGVTQADTGKFFAWDGSQIEW